MQNVSLGKAQTVNLGKEHAIADKLRFITQWGACRVKDVKYDVDIGALLLDANNSVIGFLNHGNRNPMAGIALSDDSTNGGKETIEITLSQLPKEVANVRFLVWIHMGVDRRQSFGLLEDVTSVLDLGIDDVPDYEYYISESSSSASAIVLASLKRNRSGDGFSYVTVDEAHVGIEALCSGYGLNVTWDVPQ